MPTLDKHHSSTITKLLLIGDSGSGKTGALVSLILAGYKLWIMDFDNGVDIIVNLLKKSKPELLGAVNAVVLTDTFRVDRARVVPTTASAWPRGVGLLSKWEDHGSIETFGPKDVIVVDSLNFAGRCAMRHIQHLNGRLSVPPQLQDFRDGQLLVESLCQMLYSDAIKCNVLCLTHLREIGQQQDVVDDKGRVRTVEVPGTVKGFPETGTGRALSPTIGRYFNAVLLVDIVGSGLGTRRLIRTQPHNNVGLKNSAPGIVKPSYPLETGLADYFRDLRS